MSSPDSSSRMKEQWGFEEEMKDAPWNSKAFQKKSRRQQNLEIYQVTDLVTGDEQADAHGQRCPLLVILYIDKGVLCW